MDHNLDKDNDMIEEVFQYTSSGLYPPQIHLEQEDLFNPDKENEKLQVSLLLKIVDQNQAVKE